MMRLPTFEHKRPASLRQAFDLLKDSSEDSLLVAGGTDLYPNMKRRQCEPRTVISIARIRRLKRIIGNQNSGLEIGANTVLSDLGADPVVAKYYTVLSEAATQIASPQIRETGTIGGNLCQDTRCNYYDMSYEWRSGVNFCLKHGGNVCHVASGSKRCWAVFASDIAPACMAIGSRLRLASSRGERTMPARELYQNDGAAHLRKSKDEILTDLLLPPSDGLISTYLKLRRRDAIDFPILGVAAAVRLDSKGNCRYAKIVLGAIGSCPVQVAEAEQILLGKRLTQDTIESVATAAYRVAKPQDNTDLTFSYRKSMTKVYVSDALTKLAAKAEYS